MPKDFSSAVRFFLERATLPSNMSHSPQNRRHIVAMIGCPVTVMVMPNTADSRLR